MAISNAAGIHVPPAAVKQLRTLLKYLDRLPELIDESHKLEYGITIFQVLEPFAARVGILYDDLEDIFYALENLRIFSSDYGSIEDALARILVAISPDLADEIRKNKAQIVQAFVRYNRDNPISTTFKAQKLTYLHERI